MRKAERGVTLIDTVVGSALILLVFVGIAAAFRLSIEVVTNNRSRAGAIALANERMENIRSIGYTELGTVGGIPSGTIPQTETVSLSDITYTRRVFIGYVDDPGDGTGAGDQNGITVDYKAVRVDVSWQSREGERHVVLVSRIEPANGMEINCSTPCGTISISVVNALSQPVQSAAVRIVNNGVSPAVDVLTYTNSSGIVVFPGAPVGAGYQITVSKAGYNSAQTYPSDAQNPNPNPGHLTVSQNQTTSATFAIDLVAYLTIQMYGTPVGSLRVDTFADASLLAVQNGTDVSGGRVRFAGNPPYPASAEAESVSISPAELAKWKQLTWNDVEPTDTEVRYHLYYPAPDGSFALVPNSYFSGNPSNNSSGFTEPPVDLTSIPPSQYPTLRIHAVLGTTNPGSPRPSIDDWTITYDYTSAAVNIPFNLRGTKTIGSTQSGNPIYKYDQNLNSGTGVLTVNNLEWDSYTTSVAGSTGWDISRSCDPQPIYLAPNTSTTTKIYLTTHTENSLLVVVRGSSGQLLSGATVRLQKNPSYDTTIVSDYCGQSFFSALPQGGGFSITVSKSGYQTYTDNNVGTSGTSRLSVILNQ